MNFNLLTGGAYLTNRYPTILWLEETGKEHLTAYNDGKGNVTIGVGFNLADATVRGLVLAKMGITNTQLISGLDTYLKKSYIGVADATIQKDLNNILGATFGFASASQAKELFDGTNGTNGLAQNYETQIDNWAIANGLFIIPQSKERLALLSLAYNGVLASSTSLASAILNDNRAEAWYEIRYDSNGGTDNSVKAGIAKRRYQESELFGLYDNPAGTTGIDEAASVYRMYAKHRDDIFDYEAKFGEKPDGSAGTFGGQTRNMINQANDSYPLSIGPAVQSLREELKIAAIALEAHYIVENGLGTPGTIDPLNIQASSAGKPSLLGEDGKTHTGSDRDLLIGREGESDTLNGQGGDDFLFGGSGDDVLIGGSGKDYLKGGAGDDTLDGLDGQGGDYLAGGIGNDTYYADNGDTIYDEDGIGTIYVGQSKTRLMGGERKADEPLFTSADKSQVYRENSDGSIDVWTSGGHVTIQPSPGNPGPRAQPTSDGSPDVQSGQPGMGVPLISPKPKDPPFNPPYAGAGDAVCPLIFDLDGNGIQVTNLADGVYFDHDGNGFVESTAWVGGGDGLLAWDKNNDGKITTGNELFGDRTLMKNGRWGQNGFDVLAEYDDNQDGKIDSNDAVWSNLQLWVDANHNGISSSSELHSLSEYGIQSINTAYVLEQDIDGITQRGSYTKTDGSQANAVDDRRFVADFVDTKVRDWVPVTSEIAALPDLQGYGNVYDLRQSMARDASGELMKLVQQFGLASNTLVRKELLTQILFKWTDSDQIDPHSRDNTNWGTTFDGRKLGVLEKFNGVLFSQPYSELGPEENPIADAIPLLDQSYSALFGMMYSQLMAQTHLKWLYDKVTFAWDETSQSVKANQDNVINTLVNLLATDRPKGIETIREYAQSLVDSPLSSVMDIGHFTEVLVPQGIDVAGALEEVIEIAFPGENIVGDEDDNTLVGSLGNDVITGRGGNDTLVGSYGKDYLYGEDGDDILDSGSGADHLNGGSGNDTYLFGRGYGQDTISEYDATVGNSDTILLAVDVTPNDVSLGRNTSDLFIIINGTNDMITVQNWFFNSAFRVERIEFSDGTVWDTSVMQVANFRGTGAADYINGTSGNEVIEGLGGDDYLYGAIGDDTLDGGTGNDVLNGGTGNDTYLFGRGYGQDTINDYDTTAGNTDTIRLATDVAPGDVTLWRDASALYLGINGTDDMITVQGWYGAPAYRVERIEFADGTIWDTAVMQAAKFRGTNESDYFIGTSGNDAIEGLGGDDYLAGGVGDDSLDGGTGNDALDGGTGNDTYVFGRGYGQDTINDYDTTAGNTDTIRLAADVAPGDVTLWRDASDLYLGINGTDDMITVQSWYGDLAYRVERIEFADGTIWDTTVMQAVQFIGTEQSDYLYGSSGNDVIVGLGGEDYLTGEAGNDSLDGGTDNDTLDGGSGNDTYVFGRGYGQDTISDYDTTAGNGDTILLKSDVVPNDVTLWRDTSNLYVSINGTNDTITVQSWYDDPAYRVERIEFADGTIWDTAVMQAVQFNGTEQGDYLYGSSGNDVIMGLGGDDALYGDIGNDTLDGGTGNDSLDGGTGNDTYVFGRGYGQDTINDYDTTAGNTDTILLKSDVAPGDVTLWRDASNLYLGINGASDMITVQSWYDDPAYRVERIEFADGTVWDTAVMQAAMFRGTDAADSITGTTSNDVIMGQGGDDALYGDIGNDTLDGGTGNDILDGGEGNDTYVFGRGYGQDTISDYDTTAGNSDTIRLAADVAPADLTLWRDASNLYLSINGTSDQIMVQGWYDDPAYRVERIEFTDGTVWNASIMQAATLRGTNAADSLSGSIGNDTLDGGTGNDILDGGTGNDTYVFGRGYGQDTISDYDTTAGNSDTILLKPDVAPGDVTLWRDASNLYLGINGTSDTITVQSWFDDSAYRVEKVQFADSTVWNAAILAVAKFLGTDAADYLYGTTGNDTIEGLGGDDSLSGDAGNDTLDGGTGNDSLDGGTGNDTYVFGRGYGQDTISDYDTTAGNSDTILLKADVASNDVTLWRDTSNLYVSINGTNDTITVQSWFDDPAYRVEKVQFADGTVWNTTIMQAAMFRGTDAADNITGTVGNDVIVGLGGDDALYGDIGNDTLDGGTGNDILDGGEGNDTYVFGRGYGVDSVYETSGSADTIKLNADVSPDDIMVSCDSNNLYLNIRGTNDKLAIQNWYVDPAYQTERTAFADGTIWNNATLTAKLTTVSEFADFYWGSVGDDTFNALGGDDQLIGNDGSDTLYGGIGNDLLDGGTGADTLVGGTGDDIYVVDNAADVVTENADEGIDTVQSSITYTLGDNFENLTMTGAAAINGTGNTLNNVITGNGADNVLDGGAGNDTLIGGLGNDTYLLDNPSDIVIENANEGTDTVQAGFTYTLGGNLEKLTLTGTAVIDGYGNELANTLTGNSADNTLSGGAGNDTLTGGAGNDTLDGGAGNDSLNGGAGVDTMIGGLGNDTYTVDNVGDVVTELANEGIDKVNSSIGYTLGANIENLTLTGSTAINGTGNTLDNVLTGNSGTNTLTGGAGNDTLNGGAGADTLVGGLGDDIYVVDNTGDVVAENASEGTDSVQSSITYTLGANVENLTLTGSAAINGTGNTLNNILTGNTAANTLMGGLGDDIYMVDNTGDIVTENASEGTDTVQSSVTFTLGVNVENLVLTGTTAINGTGNTLNNILTGNAAANTLSGGTGADTMAGGLGDDIYVVDNTGDVVTENASEGTDTVQSSVAYTLGANVEKLTLTGATAINGTGNALNNVLTGNTAANILDGGAGADTMTGGAGDDTYVVDNTGDIVTESASAGTDTVQSSVTFTLGANVENLVLTGTTAINGTGNTLNNVLTGNTAANTLSGGTGADTMLGGLGDDIYVVDNAGDVVTENVSEGTDIVQSSITYTLGANVENLTLTGATAINGTGNDLDNVLTGNSAVNTLTGGAGNDTLNGGAGADALIGGLGDDTYFVDNTGDVVTEAANEGIDTVKSSITYTLAANVENLTLMGTTAINGTGNALNNVLTGNSAANLLTGGAGDDIYVVGTGDTIVENTNEGTDAVQSSLTYTLGANIENLTLTGTAAISGTGNTSDNVVIGNTGVNTLTGGAGADLLNGGLGNDILNGDAGNDVLEGADGIDTLNDTAGNNLLNGGAGVDTLTGSTGNELFIGGTGNDMIGTGSGADLIAFNRGDGLDTLNVSTVADNTLSLGGGIQLTDLAFHKDGNNLVLDTGASEGIILKDWYANTANHSLLTLQMIEEAAADFNPTGGDVLRDNQIESFNFQGLADRFDQAVAANPGLTSWALTQALSDFHLTSSDMEALGGDLAYQYGKNGNLSNVGLTAAQSILSDPAFGTGAQMLKPLASLQEGALRLG